MSKNNSTILLVTLVLLSLSFGPCDESLPLYQEPSRVFSGTIEGGYTLTFTDNSMKVFFTVWNNFDETFQGNANLKGTIEIVSARDPSVRKTFNVNAQNIIQVKGYDNITGKLTIDPHDSIRYLVSWNLIDDNGLDLRTSFFAYVKDMTCKLYDRHLAYTEDFIMSGHITVFDKTGPVFAGPTSYSLCYVDKYVRPNDCPPIITSEPCNLRAPQR